MITYLMLAVMLITTAVKAQVITFNEAVSVIAEHDSVYALKEKAKMLEEKAAFEGSWGDPMFKVSANNFPKDSYKDNETPMTGIMYGVSQKIALSNKYGNIREAGEHQARATDAEAEDVRRQLMVLLWEKAAWQKSVQDNIEVLEENLQWINKMLSISKKRYARGRISQQALLDIQVRKNEVRTQLATMKINLKEVEAFIEFLTGKKALLDLKNTDWKFLETRSLNRNYDARLLKLEENFRASELGLTASRKNYLPDVTLGVNYTSRANIDNKGDFVGASISFPLPFSGSKYANNGRAYYQRESARRTLQNYQRHKTKELELLERKIEKLEIEQGILKDSSLNFAESSRKITARSYRNGQAGYTELLGSEIQYQKLQLRNNNLLATIRKLKARRLYLAGESLTGDVK